MILTWSKAKENWAESELSVSWKLSIPLLIPLRYLNKWAAIRLTRQIIKNSTFSTKPFVYIIGQPRPSGAFLWLWRPGKAPWGRGWRSPPQLQTSALPTEVIYSAAAKANTENYSVFWNSYKRIFFYIFFLPHEHMRFIFVIFWLLLAKSWKLHKDNYLIAYVRYIKILT